MKLSVSILAYNHEKFIAECIESAINQKTTFDYEIIIGEDKSSDNTREIVRAYERKYPDLIRVFYNEYPENYKRSNAWDNFCNNFASAKGKYIAYMDGDDYWSDPLKLEKQVNCLENNPNYVLCHHNMEYVSLEGEVLRTRHPDGTQREITAVDLIRENTIMMSSCMYKNMFNGQFPSYLKKVRTVDRFFNIFYLQHGLGCYIDEVMGAYRYNSGGMFNSLSTIRRTQNRIADMRLLKENISPEFIPAVNHQLKTLRKKLFKQKLKRLIGK